MTTWPFISQTEGGSRFAIVSIGIFLITLWDIFGILSSFEHVNHHLYCSIGCEAWAMFRHKVYLHLTFKVD